MQPISNASVAIPEALTDLATIAVPHGTRALALELVVADNALDQFEVQVRYISSGTYRSIASTGAAFTSPSGRVTSASGDLTLAGVGSHFLELNADGVESVKLRAASGNAAGSGVIVRGSAY